MWICHTKTSINKCFMFFERTNKKCQEFKNKYTSDEIKH